MRGKKILFCRSICKAKCTRPRLSLLLLESYISFEVETVEAHDPGFLLFTFLATAGCASLCLNYEFKCIKPLKNYWFTDKSAKQSVDGLGFLYFSWIQTFHLRWKLLRPMTPDLCYLLFWLLPGVLGYAWITNSNAFNPSRVQKIVPLLFFLFSHQIRFDVGCCIVAACVT